MKPTKREYENAMDGIKHLKECIDYTRKDIDNYLDVIVQLRTKIKEYEKIIEHNAETIMKYEFYTECNKLR